MDIDLVFFLRITDLYDDLEDEQIDKMIKECIIAMEKSCAGYNGKLKLNYGKIKKIINDEVDIEDIYKRDKQ